MKTPEELAKKFACDWKYERVHVHGRGNLELSTYAQKEIKYRLEKAFLVGYKAAQEHAHAALEEAEARHQEYVDKTEANFRALEAKIAELQAK